MAEQVLTNAKVLLENEILLGHVVFDELGIIAIGEGAAQGIDCEGDYVLPGLVELHTDNVERHFLPRPSAYWPNHLAAVMAHDSEVVGAGITTVFDALSVGDYDGENSPRRQLFEDMVSAVSRAESLGLFKANHRLHFRCELSDPNLMATLLPIAQKFSVNLVSLMDHTPGQRQWRDLDAYKTYIMRTGLSTQEAERIINARTGSGSEYTPENWKSVLNVFDPKIVPMASHDDTTVADVDQGLEAGIKISEFPCSMEAAVHAHIHGMSTIGGAPNIVRGGSHSGNVAMIELARAGVLNALSSDYVPSSLLQAPFIISTKLDLPLYETMKLVTSNPAHMVKLSDRGSIAVSKRADLIQVRYCHDTPIVRRTFVNGRRVC